MFGARVRRLARTTPRLRTNQWADRYRLCGTLSEAATVEQYIAEAPVERRDALDLLRRLCVEELAGFDEAIRHGMPSYLRGDEVKVAFASQKAYISLYVLRQALQANAARLTGLSVGKSCIRFRRPEQIDSTIVRDLLRATAGPIC